jgi:biopolymer transport protein ExbD
MSVKLKKGSALGSLSLTPLIDVVFLLLAFFLVATRFAKEERELDVVLPAASEAKPLSAKPKEIFVNVDNDGSYLVQSKIVDVDQLRDILIQASNVNPGTQSVIIRADEECSWKFVVTVMNLCNEAQITDYRVATRGKT